MNRKSSIVLASVAAAIVLAAIYVFGVEPPSKSLVGAILPLSGDGASYGKTLQNGIDLKLEQISAGSDGALQVIYDDTRLDPGAAVTAMRKLISINDVPIILGPFTSSQMMAAGPVAQKEERVIISGTATSPSISGLGSYVFRIIPSDTYDGRVVAHLIQNQLPDARNVALVTINNDYGSGIRDAFIAEVPKIGLEVSETILFPPNTSDFRVMLQRLQGAKPDVIFLVGYKEMGRFLRQMKELGIDIPVVSTGLMEDPEIVNIAQGGAEGVLYSYPSFNPTSGREHVAAFVAAFEKKYGSVPDVVAALGYDLAALSHHALENAASAKPADIRDFLLSVRDFQGVAGDISFDENGDVQKPIGVKVVRDGNFEWVTETLSLPTE